MKNLPALRYILAAAIVVMLAALASWYFVLRAKQETIARGDAARGGEIAAPFGGIVGSTYENIISSFSSSAADEKGSEAGLPRLSQVSKAPVAGAAFVGSGPPAAPSAALSGASARLRFIERATGYVLEASLETGALARRTNTLIPQVYEGIVMPKDRVILRSIDAESGALVTLAGALATTSAPESASPLSYTRLADGILSLAASPAGDEIFYLTEQGGAAGVRAAWNGAKPKQVFSSAISGWRVRWSAPDRILLVQNASDGAAGYAYELGAGGAAPLLRNIAGLTALPHPSSKALLYGRSGGGLALFARINDASSVVSLPVRTTAEKCVWAPSSAKATEGKPATLIAYCAVPQVSPGDGFLDRRYRGEMHTADAWWRIDVGAATAELLYSPGSIELDVEDPVIDESGNYIAFINARDKSLWLLRVKE
ncbi:hypothetical protein A3C21_00350 [Candidatus Kaiserbacteria bacterium RIFCSPHIGHO2_02_FULL_59_21]|uniref:Uncharacterized protein n=1 Tax=Candidatus Kaiserbacteria bacterium RIFCSPHIGHO2_02_FULL_59_21 TaxID=1798500 RepID=A0A1F6E1P1_9BACT|nr:MAG: hypothetical protein A3C21_00350 [Candidatus Kaiserbacteria bacterium RIFCSPHIGHO2_02_FULL_59_21]OGG80393.1 MAG: hypothetical protein A2952_01560 [Candidatus Kaiserbacteria bacterium RIFCSPLOWO2_01_FULL_59_34]